MFHGGREYILNWVPEMGEEKAPQME